MNLLILYIVLSISFLIGIIMLYIKGGKSRNNNGNNNSNCGNYVRGNLNKVIPEQLVGNSWS
jgi:hypothetical protein